MRQKSGPLRAPAEQVVKDIRRSTRRQFSAEDKIRIVLDGLRGEDSIAELCRKALPGACNAADRRSSWRWASDGYPGTPRATQPLARSRRCAPMPVSSRRRWPR